MEVQRGFEDPKEYGLIALELLDTSIASSSVNLLVSRLEEKTGVKGVARDVSIVKDTVCCDMSSRYLHANEVPVNAAIWQVLDMTVLYAARNSMNKRAWSRTMAGKCIPSYLKRRVVFEFGAEL